jgi:tetratricopeptide (TPR) repeat protein
LRDQEKLDEAVASFKKAIELGQKDAIVYCNLGAALRDHGNLDEAVAELRKAIALDLNDAESHCELGRALAAKGEFREALEEARRGHELGSKDPNWRFPSAKLVRRIERLVELDGNLPGFLEGKVTPTSPGEGIEIAQLCLYKRLSRAAARFYEEAFVAQPKLAERPNSHRYNAACVAALAGCGQGKDADRLDGKERAGLRRQALDWLRADLAAWGRLLEKEPDKTGPALAKTMQHLQQDSDFTGVRGPEALAKLPEAERQEWQKLWADVGDMLERTKGKR